MSYDSTSWNNFCDRVVEVQRAQAKIRAALEAPVDPAQPWIGHPREAEFERSFAAHEAAMEACTCEWDGGHGEDGRGYRRTPAAGCPTHAEEDAGEAA
jgi:hypothetical protein